VIVVPSLGARVDFRRQLVWLLLSLGVAVALTGLIQEASGNNYIYGLRAVVGDRDPFGPYYNRNHAATLMSMAALAGLGLVASMWARARRPQTVGNLSNTLAQQVIVAAFVLTLVIGVHATESRAGLIAMVAALGAVGIASLMRIKAWLTRAAAALSLAVLLGVAGLFFWKHPLWLGKTDGGIDLSGRYRISLYNSAASIIADFPLAGSGFGSTARVFPPYQMPPVNGLVRHIHSDWLELVAHEFFHLWNVKRIRPAVLGPFDYEKEVHTSLLWAMEGLTSYYDAIIPTRAKSTGWKL
jgi:O-antigen ligase